MSSYKVIDNFLEKEEWEMINHMCCGGDGFFCWYVQKSIANEEYTNPLHYYFTHTFYNHNNSQSEKIEVLRPLIDRIKSKSLIRIKANLYPRTEIVDIHDPHVDYDYKHKGAVYMVNDNDGFTTMHDGHRVESVANRIVFFDPNKLHNSSSCTNQKYRVTINFNYFWEGNIKNGC